MEHVLIPHIFNDGVKAFFTQKALGTHIPAVSRFASFDEEQIFFPIQQHTDIVFILERDMKPQIADAVITKQKNILLGIQTADCVPILLHDRRRNIIAAVHAGWRGTAKGIVKNTITVMRAHFQSSTQDIFVAFGPSIRWNCYGVGPEVAEAVSRTSGKGKYYRRNGNGQYIIDLCSANIAQMMSIGIPECNMWISDECTFCNPEKYYSYRYNKAYKGNQGGFIGII